MLQTVVDISNQHGTKAKTKILEIIAVGKYSTDCAEFKYLLQVAFDPFILTHISKIDVGNSVDPIHLLGDSNSGVSFAEFKKLVSKLTAVKAMNNDLRAEAESFCKRIADKNQREVLVKILTKSLNIGISTSSINKIWPNLIFNREVMLASKDMSVVKDWKPEDIIINVKYDGIRLIAHHAKGAKGFQFFTRSFNEISQQYLSTINTQLVDIFLSHPGSLDEVFFVDGELTSKTRLAVSGDLNRMLRDTYVGTGDNLIYNVFDYVHSDAIVENIPKHIDQYPYRVRKDHLKRLIFSTEIENVVYAEEYTIKSFDDIQPIYDKMIKRGEEGIIVKNLNAAYEFKRSDWMVKMKAINTADLIIVHVNRGKDGTKFANSCGAVDCETSDGKLSVNVSGMTDEIRDKLWKSPKTYIGTIVEVLYNAKIANKNGENSLFLPRLKPDNPFREDKVNANTLEELK